MQVEVSSLTFLNRAGQLHFERQADLSFLCCEKSYDHLTTTRLTDRLGNRAMLLFKRSSCCIWGLRSWILTQVPAEMFQLLHLWLVFCIFLNGVLHICFNITSFQISYCLSLHSKKDMNKTQHRSCCNGASKANFRLGGAAWKGPC